MWNLKKRIKMNLFTKQKQTHRHRKQTCDYQREKWGKGQRIETLQISSENKQQQQTLRR